MKTFFVRSKKPEKEDTQDAITKKRAALIALIPSTFYLVFYNVFSYLFFHQTDFLASFFGAIIFWFMYFLLLVIGRSGKNKK